MTTQQHADPATPTPVEGAGSRRLRVLPVLVVGVLLAALVRAALVQSAFVPSAALAPTLEPGDRVLVWKVDSQPQPGDVVVVDTTGTATVDRATPTDDGLVGRVLGGIGRALGVRIGTQERLAVVDAVTPEGLSVRMPDPATVPAADVVGVVSGRFWPLDRLGAVEVAR